MRAVIVIFILATCIVDLSSAQETKKVYPGIPVTIASDGYPGLIKTWTNYTTQAYRIHQPTTESNLLFLFDRFDLQSSDVLNLCTLAEYRKFSEDRDYECTMYLVCYYGDPIIVEWDITNGDPIVFLDVQYDTRRMLSQDPNGYARAGFRTTVMVKDPQREFFECGSTIHLPEPALPTDRPAPIYFVSQGYPNSPGIYYNDCVVKVLGTDGIRFTFLDVDVTYNDTITISGTSINRTQVIYNQDTEGTLYFQHNATITFNMLSNGTMKRFAVYVEPFRVVAPSCPFLPKTYSNTEFDITTAGFSTTSYDDNLNCKWKMTDLKPNAQLVVEGLSVSLELFADVLRASDNFPDGQSIRSWDTRLWSSFYYSDPNITDAEFSLVTDGLESLVGVNAHVHILNCSNTQPQLTMVSGQTLPLSFPGNNSKAFCQEVLYQSFVDVPKELAFTVTFSIVDLAFRSNFTISAGENTLHISPVTGMQLVFSGYPNYEISFFAPKSVTPTLPQGIRMFLSANPVPIETKTVCDSMEVIESSSKLSDYQEYSMSSCGGRKLVVYVIADQVSTGVISLFNGDFDVIPPVDIILGEPIVLSEKISLRISTLFMSQPKKFTIVISDRFLDNDGICGGVVKYDSEQESLTLPIHYPCMAIVYGTFDHMNISRGSMELYDGLGMKDDSRNIVNGSNSPDASVIQFPLRQQVFTMRTMEGYNGNIVAKAIDENSRSSTVRIEEENQSYYIYSSLPQLDGDSSGTWDLMCNISQYLQSRPVEVFLELLSPLGEDDSLNVDGIYYSRADGLVRTEINSGSDIHYFYSRHYYNSLLFARLYVTFIVPNTTAGYPSVPTTSERTTTSSTTETTVRTIPPNTTAGYPTVPTTSVRTTTSSTTETTVRTIPPNTTAGYKTVPTTSGKTTSTLATTVTTIPSSTTLKTTSRTTSVTTTSPSSGSNLTTTTQVIDPENCDVEAPGYLFMTISSLYIALLGI